MDPSNGRDPQSGKFLPGHKFASGNPIARRMNELRRALVCAQTPEDVLAVGKSLLQSATDGDSSAANVYLSFIIGRPLQSIALVDSDGQPLGLKLDTLIRALYRALTPIPEARRIVGDVLMELAGNVYRAMHIDDNDIGSESSEVGGIPTSDDDGLSFDT